MVGTCGLQVKRRAFTSWYTCWDSTFAEVLNLNCSYPALNPSHIKSTCLYLENVFLLLIHYPVPTTLFLYGWRRWVSTLLLSSADLVCTPLSMHLRVML